MLRLKVSLSDATAATRFATGSGDRQPSPSITKLTHMSMNTPGLTCTTPTSIDTRKARQHYSWRALKHSNNCLTNLRTEEGNSDNSTAQLKEYTPRLADSLRRATPVVRAIQHVAESDKVAPATDHLGDGCKATERLAVDRQMPARKSIRLHLSDEEESALSKTSTPKKAIPRGDDGIGSKLAWSPTGEEFTIAIASSSPLQRQHVPVLEGEQTKSLCTSKSRWGGAAETNFIDPPALSAHSSPFPLAPPTACRS
jgi:hypothetical protein